MRIPAFMTVLSLGLGISAGMSHAAAPARGTRGAARGQTLQAAADRGGGAGRGQAAQALADRAGARGNVAVSTTRQAAIDQREANQQKRIEQGIKKGQLTPDETTRLQALETSITTQESTFKSDGKLSRDEAQQLRQALNEASLQIWAERHDTEGNQKPVSRLGKDIVAQDAFTAKIESGDLTRAEAKTFLQDFRQMATLKRRLASETLTDAQRTELQAKFNDLLNKYFVQK